MTTLDSEFEALYATTRQMIDGFAALWETRLNDDQRKLVKMAADSLDIMCSAIMADYERQVGLRIDPANDQAVRVLIHDLRTRLLHAKSALALIEEDPLTSKQRGLVARVRAANREAETLVQTMRDRALT